VERDASFLERCKAAAEVRRRRDAVEERAKKKVRDAEEAAQKERYKQAHKNVVLSPGAAAAMLMSAMEPHREQALIGSTFKRLENQWRLAKYDAEQASEAERKRAEEEAEAARKTTEEEEASIPGPEEKVSIGGQLCAALYERCICIRRVGVEEDIKIGLATPSFSTVHILVQQDWFHYFFLVAILFNNVILLIEVNSSEGTVGKLIGLYGNTTCTVLFTIELLLKLLGFRWDFFHSIFNIFDLLIVVASYAEIIIRSDAGTASSLRSLRLMRIVFILKLGRLSRTLSAVHLMVDVLGRMSMILLTLLGLLTVFCATFAVMGMHLFGGKLFVTMEGRPLTHYEDFPNALLSTFVLLTRDDMAGRLAELKAGGGWAASIYALVVVLLGHFVLLSLLMATIIWHMEASKISQEIIKGGFGSEAYLVYEAFLDPGAETNAKVLPSYSVPNSPAVLAGSNFSSPASSPKLSPQMGNDAILDARRLQDELEGRNNGQSDAVVLPPGMPAAPVRVRPRASGDVLGLEAPPVFLPAQHEVPYSAKDCLIFHYEAGMLVILRLWGLLLVRHRWFLPFSELVVLGNCVLLAVDPRLQHYHQVDIVFTGLLGFEIVLRLLASTPRVFFLRFLDVMDLMIFLFSIGGIFEVRGWHFGQALRVLRLLRPFNLLLKWLFGGGELQFMLLSISKALPGLLNVLLMACIAFMVWAVLGVDLFKGRGGGWCNDLPYGWSTPQADCTGYLQVEGSGTLRRQWYTSQGSFEDTWEAGLMLTQVSLGHGWVAMMEYYTLHPISDMMEGLYFVSWVMVSWLLIAICLGIVFISMQETFEEHEGLADLDEQHGDHLSVLHWVLTRRPLVSPARPWKRHWLRRLCFDVTAHRIFQMGADSLVVMHAIICALRYSGEPEALSQSSACLGALFALFFAVEAGMHCHAYTVWVYWQDPSNRLEVFCALFIVPEVYYCMLTFQGSASVTYLMLIRFGAVLRCLRLICWIDQLPELRVLLNGIEAAFSSFCQIALLLGMLLYVWAVAAVLLWFNVKAGPGMPGVRRLDTFGHALWSLFMMSLGDSLPGITQDCRISPPDCMENVDCGSFWAPLFFFPFGILSNFLFVSALLAAIINCYMRLHRVGRSLVQPHHIEQLRYLWSLFDSAGEGYVATHQLRMLVMALDRPLGLQMGDKITWLSQGTTAAIAESTGEEAVVKSRRASLVKSRRASFKLRKISMIEQEHEEACEEGPEDNQLSDRAQMEVEVDVGATAAAVALINKLQLVDYNGRCEFKETAWALCNNAFEAAGSTPEVVQQRVEAQRSNFKVSRSIFHSSAAERLAVNVIVKAITRRTYHKGLKKGLLSTKLLERLNLKHCKGSARMKEVRACEILLNAIKHFQVVKGGAMVNDAVWAAIPNEYELEWDNADTLVKS